MDVSSRAVAVGELITVTLTVKNQAPDPANDLVVTMPLPAGAVAHQAAQRDGWRWQRALLARESSVTYTAVMRLAHVPSGDALLVRATATAKGLNAPATATGGAVVVQRGSGPATAVYAPGVGTVLRSRDGRTEVQLPPNAANRALTLRYDLQAPSGQRPPRHQAGAKRGFGNFYLNAADTQGADYHQFSAPLTITISYTPQQIEALGLSEDNLALYWFDESGPDGGEWVMLPAKVDSRNHKVTAHVDHFSIFELGEDFRPSDVYIPSLQGWQVGLYTGNVSMNYPIDVPAGPGGLKPSIELGYNSTATDGGSGVLATNQATWVGKGWSLDLGYIALNKLDTVHEGDRYYSMVLNGQSFDLVRGKALITTTTDLKNPTHWEWHPTDENFMRVRAVSNGVSYGSGNLNLGRGGFLGGASNPHAYPRYKWQVWTKEGTRYEFEEDAWQAWSADKEEECGSREGKYFEAYKWHMSAVVDTHGNKINYGYQRDRGWSQRCNDTANWLRGTTDTDVYPYTITWGVNVNVQPSTPRYMAIFTSTTRTIDNDFVQNDTQVSESPHETRQLHDIGIYSNQSQSPYNANSWDMVRRYHLGFETSTPAQFPQNYLLSDGSSQFVEDPEQWHAMSDTWKITLKTLQMIGSDNSTPLPPMTFNYGLTRGTGYYPNGAWNRLTSVDNGQGGVMNLTYTNVGTTLVPDYAPPFRNTRRVATRTLSDGMGNSYAWSYDYRNDPATSVADKPQMNSLGLFWTDPKYGDPEGIGPNLYPNSAQIYFNEHFDRSNINFTRDLLIHRRHREFRGHAYVVETGPNNDETEHRFYQGGAECYPLDGNNEPVEGEDILSNECFQDIRNREILKGREYQTVSYEGTVLTGTKLSEVSHEHAIPFVNYAYPPNSGGVDDRLTGLWQSYSYESRTIQKAWEGTTTPLTRSTEYTYDHNNYGNLSQMDELDEAGIVLRTTRHSYAVLSDTLSYIVDRKRSDNVADKNGNWLSRTVYAYDGSTGTGYLTRTGELTLVRKVYDLAFSPILPTYTHVSDMSYDHDDWGNPTKAISYAAAGAITTTVEFSPDEPEPEAPNDVEWGPPGGGSTPMTTTTTYDANFHAFPVSVDKPITGLAETMGYDYRMGTQTSATDANGNVIEARYDVFGRMDKLIKPGDTVTIPTARIDYRDFERPVLYIEANLEVSGQSELNRPILHYYDGLGRKIQTKSETEDGSTTAGRQIVEDNVYDGLGQVIRQSQPREISQTTLSGYWTYVQPDANVRWTITFYDAAGRPQEVAEPDTATMTTMEYSIVNDSGTGGVSRRAAITIDPNLHKTRHNSDMYGRLMSVNEYAGIGSPGNPHVITSTTSYGYNPLDLLTVVTDTNSYTTSMKYDSLGRKSEMTDLTMGRWLYTYDVNGNIKSQVDPMTQTINFSYDAMFRLTGKSYPGSTQDAKVYNYDQTIVSNGKGRRTSMSTPDMTTRWDYDARGRVTHEEYASAHFGGVREYDRTYDSGNRLTTITYPTVAGVTSREVVSYTYDAGWRQTKLYSHLYAHYYANEATYTALNATSVMTLGNGLKQFYNYTTPMERLQQIQVGTTTNPGSIYNRTYGYDNDGNVTSIGDAIAGESHSFQYDHRNRLTQWALAGGSTETYSYDKIGNFLSKAGSAYTYSSGNGGPYAARTIGGQSYTYDANGNMLSGGGRSYTWNIDNQPTEISIWPTTEQYIYDADGQRFVRTMTQGSTTRTTYYLGGLYEEDASVASSITTRVLYQFNSAVVAHRTVNSNPLTNILHYLHTDHLGSVSVSTKADATQESKQAFDPWGKVRPGGTGTMPTKLNYTGQRKDNTGLLYYNARYYDPVAGRFTSPDSIVPGAAYGAEDNSQLTVDFRESNFVSSVNGENASVLKEGFGFQRGANGQSTSNAQGPHNPQDLNRYSYVRNNPLRYIDLTGHQAKDRQGGGRISAQTMLQANSYARELQKYIRTVASKAGAAGAALISTFGEVGKRIIAGIKWSGAAVEEQLKHIYGKHGKALDLACEWFVGTGNYKQNAAAFKQDLLNHFTDPFTQIIKGTFRGMAGSHFWNPSTNKWIFVLEDGTIHAGEILQKHQVHHLIVRSSIGGGN